jgi:hypothetical protein
MKTLVFLGVFLVPIVGIVNYLSSPSVAHAQPMERASANLQQTQQQLRTAATKATNQVQSIQQGLTSPEPGKELPKELQDFNTTTIRLTKLREDLGRDITEYQTAYNTQLERFDQERAAITDPSTARSMMTLRRHTEQDTTERLEAARATLEHLDSVIAKGADLAHAAKCVLIAEELHTHGTDLDTQLKTAKDQATAYASMTNGLLSRINTALSAD